MSLKSISAFARIANRERDGHRTATGIDAKLWVLPEFAFEEAGVPTERSYDPDGFVDLIHDVQTWCSGPRDVPVVCVCDGMLDLCLSWAALCSTYKVTTIAKGRSDFFTISLHDRETDKEVARIFDLRHLMPRGVPGMAELVGMTRDGTAMQDCRIMSRYAAELIVQHDLDEAKGDEGTEAALGSRVLTLTSLARYEVDKEIGKLEYERKAGRRYVLRNLRTDYLMDARNEAPRTYYQYGIRRACMRGGYAFNAATESNQILGRTVAIDETSAHHAHAVGHWVPEGFKQRGADWLQAAANRIVTMPKELLLAAYAVPFLVYIHAEVEFRGLRPKAGSVFEAYEIGLAPTARLAKASGVMGVDNESMVEAERALRAAGFRDRIDGEVEAAFGKIMQAESLTTWVTELELWCMAQAYDWDEMIVHQGEAATKAKRPDDYAILTSMHFWSDKQKLKADISEAEGEARQRLRARYRGEVKPQFNAVGYGLHARDEYRPGWTIDDEGTWKLEPAISEEDFAERAPRKPRAWFNYGSRISGWSRVHLIIAMELLFEKFGTDARIVAGDTDSLKVRTDIPETDIVDALAPLHRATRAAIERTTSRAAEMWPEYYDPMEGVGEFVPEMTAATFYTPGVKEYAQIFPDGSFSLTCAGVPGEGEHSFGSWLKIMVDEFGPTILERAFAFDIQLAPGVSQLSSIDYTEAEGYELPQRKGMPYTLNCLDDPDNRQTLAWQREHGRKVYVDNQAICSWTPAGPRFTYRYGIIEPEGGK